METTVKLNPHPANPVPNITRGRNGYFDPKSIRLLTFRNNLYVDVFSKRQGDHAPITLNLTIEEGRQLAAGLLLVLRKVTK